MTKSTGRRAMLASALAVLATVLPFQLQPAAADHATSTLQVSPELSSADVGTPIALKATLSSPVAAGEQQISFEVEGASVEQGDVSPDTPDYTCAIAQGSTSCNVAVSSATAGTALVRAWADDDRSPLVKEQDAGEGRLSQVPGDCMTEQNPTVCLQGTAAPGDKAEPDDTDVVQVTFTTPGGSRLDCDDKQGRDSTAVQSGRDVELVCRLTDLAGAPRGAGIVVDGENTGSGAPDTTAGSTNGFGANDPDNNGVGGPESRPDYKPGTTGPNNSVIQNGAFCITGSDGTCTGTVPWAGEQGPAIVCFWVDDDGSGDNVYNAAGDQQDGGQCDEELPAAEDDGNPTDLLRIQWEPAAATTIDVTPDTSSSPAGTTVALAATVTDQFGTAVNEPIVRGELFENSPNDADGNRPNPADITCIKNNDDKNYTCNVSGDREGTDRICFWFEPRGPGPVMTGTNETGVCDSEGLANDGATAGVDVVTVTWTPRSGPQPRRPTGYWMTASDGGVFAFGDADFHGSTGAIRLSQPIVGMASTPTRKGYWLVARDGGVFAFGDARFFGSTGAIRLSQPVVGIAASPTGQGYWLVARDGGVFAFGDARFFGSTGAIRLSQPVAGIAATPTGQGYWLVAADGGVFAFGDARFLGSTGAIRLNQPVVGMAAKPTGGGYWLVAADGGVFAFGDARFFGSTGSIRLNEPIVGMSTTTTGDGYRFVARDGGVFAFGEARFLGSMGGRRLNQPVVGMDGF